MLEIKILIFIIISYLTGAIPTAVWLGKYYRGIDLRQLGSGNSGATNAFRILGFKLGSFVLIFDVFKSMLAVYYLDIFFDIEMMSKEQVFENKIAFGIAAVIGHVFPIYVGFRGGKGIASLLGIIIALTPLLALYITIVFLIFLFVFRYVSLASIIASLSFPLILVLTFKYDFLSLNLFSYVLPILSLITHKKNILRLYRGEETKVIFGNK